MSELREEILGPGINKKRIIGVILVAILLISIFAFSTVFYSFLFGTQRPKPSERKAEADYEDALLIKPPSPFDSDFWQDLFDQIDPDDLPALLDMLSEMMDGDIDDLDLGNFSQGLLELLFAAAAGEIEVFRVYNYLSFDDMEDVLWKYEAFDEYTGESWTSNAATDLFDFYSYGDYLSKYSPDPELLTIKMPLSPNSGINSMIIPTLFPSPFVIDGSFSAPNLNTGTEQLYKDEYNATTIDLYFSSENDVNMTFDMFGFYNHLPTPDELNNSAVEASWTPSYITDKYLQLPPSIGVYRSNNGYFDYHLSILEGIVDINDNAFQVANTIRNYLQTNFNFPQTQDDYNPAPEGRDVIDWFCETEQGVWSDFASAFCAFSRAFGIASRFIDGFNSFMTETDNDEDGEYFAIKYKNLYNWAEIYIPTDISGDGKWVQFDIFDSYGGGGNPIIGGDYNITVTTDKLSYTRPETATITATLSSNTDPVDNVTITFEDYTEGLTLGQDITDITGTASIQVDFDSSYTVGPHLIEASYDFFNRNYTIAELSGDISIALTNVNPGEINISDAQPDITNVSGYVFDPLNGKRVQGPELNIILLEKGTSIIVPNVFSPPAINTTTNGVFTDLLTLNYNDDGYYGVRADFNGSWVIDTPLGPQQYPTFTVTHSSSNRMELNITKELDVQFYINGTPSNYPNTPPNSFTVSRTQTLNLTARVFSVISGPYQNKEVFFYDYTRGNVLLGSAISNINGYASINYYVGGYCLAGPNLLYARLGSQENYSYFILNEVPTINIISGPTPRVINRSGAGATQFNIVGEIYDSTNNSLPISYSEITLIMRKGGSDYSSYLEPSENYPYQTDSSGNFDLTFGVLDNTPPGNYTLRLDFNGTIDLLSYPYSYQFFLPGLSTSSTFTNDLKIEAELSLLFWINGIPSDDTNNPQITRNEDLTLTTYIHQAGNPIDDNESVYFYDITQDNLSLGSDQTVGGYASVIYDINDTTTAGPHLIYATWNNKFNYSYFILDAPINASLDIFPVPREINRSGSIDRNFTIHGFLIDGLNGNPIKHGEINVYMYDGINPVSTYLQLESGSLQLGTSGEIDLIYSVSEDTTAKNYTLEVEFDGEFIYTNPNYPYYFNLNYLNNLTDTESGLYDLRVWDPENITIYLFIDGNPTLSFYNDSRLPEIFKKGAKFNFTVIIRQGSNWGTGLVTLRDVYNNSILSSYPYGSGDFGYHNFTITTGPNWYAGLHKIKVEWGSYEAFNSTYIIINDTVSISNSIDNAMSSIDDIILRNVDSFSVFGNVSDSGVFLRGLVLNIVLFDSAYNDVTSSYLIGTNSLRINNDGSFDFSNLQISLSCPQGFYWLNITFTGDIDDTGILLTNKMVHSSSLIQINVTAGTYIVGNYDTEYYKDDFYYLDTLYVYGTLYWDNGTFIPNTVVNVTIRDQSGSILATNTGLTDPSGFFNISFTIGIWGDEDTIDVWANFYPEDTPFPDSDFIVYTEQKVFREP